MKKISLSAICLVLGLITVGAVNAQTELDPSIAAIPSEIIVREDAHGNREVFKVAEKSDVSDAKSAIEAINIFVKADNKVSTVVAESELDHVSSTEAWYYFFNNSWFGFNYTYNYGYNFYGYNYYYQPYFYYNYGYYNYYYYRWF